MPDEQTYSPWDDATDDQRRAVIEMWWAKASPEPDSDEYLILQKMSGPDMGHGDPEAAEQELFARGLLERCPGHQSSFTDKGREVFFRLDEKVLRAYDISAAEPTPEGIKRHPPDGYYRTDFFEEPVSEPCTCAADCPEFCEGDCGCEACATRLQVFAASGSAAGEQ